MQEDLNKYSKYKIKPLFGREVHDIPNSLANKPEPSDKPTKVLSNNNFIPDNLAATPDTTVLGLDDEIDNPSEVVDNSILVENEVLKPSLDNVQNREVKTIPKSFKQAEDSSNLYVNKNENKSTVNSTSDDSKHVKPKQNVDQSFTNINQQVSTEGNVKLSNNNADKISEEGIKKNKSEKASSKQGIKEKIKFTKPKVKDSNLLLVRSSNGEIIRIINDNFVIGKSKYTNYQVTGNNTVSRRHILIHKKNNGNLYIEDNDSKNGTFLDGQRLKAHQKKQLVAGQSLRLSDEVFEVREA